LRAAAACGRDTNWEIRLTQNEKLGDKNLAGGGAAHLFDSSSPPFDPQRAAGTSARTGAAPRSR
jgi:hypothetical protein